MSGGNIKVVCRFRPQNRVENENNGTIVVDFSDEQTVTLEHSKGKNTFAFDRVFDWTVSQKEVFTYGAKQVVEDVMNGYNGTIFAYGQTGSGKTFTMQGPDVDSPELRGLIPRIVEYIFTSISSAPATIEFTVSISYLEIYMEKIRDLLDKSKNNLEIHEEKGKGVYVKGLTSVYVSSPDETVEVMKVGTNNRAIAATNMNEESSRSHSVMLLAINQKNLKDGSNKSGKLYLVDLAGSEMISKTGATGQTLEEAKKINKSLTALGMVINALTDGKSTHIPYRDSKLTRLLQESLGGNSRTTLVINCSPSSYNDSETLSTLRFGMRAKKIENKAKINQELSAGELRKLLDVARKQIQNFQRLVTAMEEELAVWRSGGTVSEENYVQARKFLEGDRHHDGEKTPEKLIATPLERTAQNAAAAAAAAAAAEEDLTKDDSSAPTESDEEELDDSTPETPAEGDLLGQIVEKEVMLKTQEALVEKLQKELGMYRSNEAMIEQFTKEKQELTHKLNEALFKLEKQSHEHREEALGFDSFKASHQSMAEELAQANLRIQELEEKLRQQEQETSSEKLRAKMAEGMASVNHFNDEIAMRENEMRATLEKLSVKDGLASPARSSADAEKIARKYELRVAELEASLEKVKSELVITTNKNVDIQQKLTTLEEEYENLLDDMIAKEESETTGHIDSAHELKEKLEAQYNAKKQEHIKQIEDLRLKLVKRENEIERQKNLLVDQKWQIEHLQTTCNSLQSRIDEKGNSASGPEAYQSAEVEAMKNMMSKQLEEFNRMKENLMKDLQNRCEKVVQLEISLDQARDQYQSLLRNANTKNQQKKMVTLEKSLEQVTSVHKQLVEQNSQLKREAALTARKLEARAERIHNLEVLLQNEQETASRQTQSYENEIRVLQEKLAAASQKDLGGLKFAGSNIAKPIRGGGGTPSPSTPAPATPAVQQLKSQGTPSTPPTQASPSKGFWNNLLSKN